MLEAKELLLYAEKNKWLIIEEDMTGENEHYIRYLTPSGARVIVRFYNDGSISSIYP